MPTEAPPAPPVAAPEPTAAPAADGVKTGLLAHLERAGIFAKPKDAPAAKEAAPAAAPTPADDAPKEPKKPKGDAPKAEDAPAPAPVEAPAKPKRAKAAPAPPAQVDPEAIAAAVAKGVTQANEASKQAAKPKPEDNLSDRDKATVEVLRKMEEMNPEYKGISKRYVDSVKVMDKYEDDWSERNPGAEFNIKDEEHKAFLDKHDVDWEPEDFDGARVELTVERRMKDAVGKMEGKLTELERQNRVLAEQPKIAAAAAHAEQALLKKLGIAKIEEHEDKIVSDYALAAIPMVHDLTRQASLLYDGLTKYDPENPSHVILERFIRDQETAIAGQSDNTDSEGRTFATMDQFVAMSATERKRHWVLTKADVLPAITEQVAFDVRTSAEAKRQEILRYTGSPASKNGDPEPKAETKNDESDGDDAKPAEPNKPKPVSPTVQADPKMTPAQAKPDSTQKDNVRRFLPPGFMA